MTNQKTLYFREFLLSESILIGQGGVVNRTTLRAVDWGRAGRVVRLATSPWLTNIFQNLPSKKRNPISKVFRFCYLRVSFR